MSLEIKINGLAELNKLLDQLPLKIEANVLRAGMRAGAMVIRDEARRLCPVGYPSISGVRVGARIGELQRSIRVSVRSRRGVVMAKITAGNSKAWYAHLVEFGTAAHFIRSKYGKEMYFRGRFAKVIHHPGAQRKPFMRPAIDSKALLAVEAMADYMRARIPLEIAKLK